MLTFITIIKVDDPTDEGMEEETKLSMRGKIGVTYTWPLIFPRGGVTESGVVHSVFELRVSYLPRYVRY